MLVAWHLEDTFLIQRDLCFINLTTVPLEDDGE